MCLALTLSASLFSSSRRKRKHESVTPPPPTCSWHLDASPKTGQDALDDVEAGFDSDELKKDDFFVYMYPEHEEHQIFRITPSACYHGKNGSSALIPAGCLIDENKHIWNFSVAGFLLKESQQSKNAIFCTHIYAPEATPGWVNFEDDLLNGNIPYFLVSSLALSDDQIKRTYNDLLDQINASLPFKKRKKRP